MALLISYKHKFLFIHIFKTAGSSVASCLVPHARVVDRIVYGYWFTRKTVGMLNRILGWRDLSNKPFTGFRHHEAALDVKKKLSEEVYNSLFKFAFVRNPWDWRVSLYFYVKRRPQHKFHKTIKDMSFSDFIKWDVSQNTNKQIDFITDENGNIIIDYVGKFESLNEDFEFIRNKLSIPNLKTNIPQINVSNNREFRDYRNYYDNETRNLVEDYYRDDIEKFGYKFE